MAKPARRTRRAEAAAIPRTDVVHFPTPWPPDQAYQWRRRTDLGMNSDDGVMYLMTGDGLHLATIGEMGPESTLDDARGHSRHRDRDQSSAGEFHPTLNQNPDGTLTLVSGKTHLSLIDIEGLESTLPLHRARCVVDADVVEKAKPTATHSPSGRAPTRQTSGKSWSADAPLR